VVTQYDDQQRQQAKSMLYAWSARTDVQRRGAGSITRTPRSPRGRRSISSI